MITRRELVRRTALGGLALALPKTFLRAGGLAPSDELRVAVVGLRGRGRNHIDGFRRIEGVRVAALCDVDGEILGREVAKFEERGEKVDAAVDLRKLLERDDIDAVSIATPNHWHALQAIWCCQAGKDVYLEKPVSHNVWEGGQIVRAARKHGRLVQTGTQSRSSHAIAEAIEWLQEGHLGKIELARGLCYKPRQSIGKVAAAQEVPGHIDYDLWTGPAPLVPLMRKRLHYDWHWVSSTGNGDVGNQGIHQMDLARWALGETRLPSTTFSVGGRLGYDDDGNTPNTQIVVHGYGEGRAPLVFEVRGLPRDKAAQEGGWGGGEMDAYQGAKIGVIVHCEKGYLRLPNYSEAIAFDADGTEVKRWKGATDHYANFVDAVRSGKQEDLNADIREGHVSSAMCHMGNVSHALGKQASVGEIREALHDANASESLERMVAHLGANGVDLDATPLTLGVALGMNPETERFVGNEDADRLSTRAYRAPFVVPESV